MLDPPGPMGAPGPLELMAQLMSADEAGVKLEVVQGEFVWGFFPSPLHQGKDVVAVDPEGRQAHHFRRASYRPIALGAGVRLECGRELTIPVV